MLTDLRHAVRALRSTPAFTAVALIVLTLGIGATTAIFSVVDGIALRGLPFSDAGRLVAVEETHLTSKTLAVWPVAAANFIDWRAQQRVFEQMAAVQAAGGFTVRDGGEPEDLRVQMASASLFSILRVAPAIGHAFAEENEVRGNHRVGVISDGLWRRRFGADPAIVGKTMTFDDGAWQIVGVMPPGFTYPIGPGKPCDMWIPYVPLATEVPRGDGSARNYNALVVAFDDPLDQADIKTISSGYFRAIDVPVLAGRAFTDADGVDDAAPVVMLNDIAARRFFGDQDPIGTMVQVDGARTVVGIVKGVRLQGPEGELRPEAYVPFTRTRAFGATIVLRTSRDPAAVVPDVRAVIRAVAPDMVIPEAQTMQALFDTLIVQRRFNMLVLALFGGLAVVIAAAGIYGVMTYIVEQRTQEIGVRMALGARPSQVLGMVLGRAVIFMAMGLGLGLAGGWFLARLVQAFLFKVEAHDPIVYASAAAVLVIAGLSAALIPALRASRVDPTTALR